MGGDSLLWEITDKKEPHHLKRRLKGASVNTQWNIEIKEIKDGVSQVIITEKGTITNPFERFVAKISFGTNYIDRYLMDIAFAYGEIPKVLTLKQD